MKAQILVPKLATAGSIDYINLKGSVLNSKPSLHLETRLMSVVQDVTLAWLELMAKVVYYFGFGLKHLDLD